MHFLFLCLPFALSLVGSPGQFALQFPAWWFWHNLHLPPSCHCPHLPPSPGRGGARDQRHHYISIWVIHGWDQDPGTSPSLFGGLGQCPRGRLAFCFWGSVGSNRLHAHTFRPPIILYWFSWTLHLRPHTHIVPPHTPWRGRDSSGLLLLLPSLFVATPSGICGLWGPLCFAPPSLPEDYIGKGQDPRGTSSSWEIDP